MMKAIRLFLASVLVSVFVVGSAMAEDDASLSVYYGDWQAEGIAFGQPAVSSMQWEPVLNGKFVRLEYRIKMNPDTDKQAEFIGVGHYQATPDDSFEGFWVDNYGDMHRMKSTLVDGVLTTYWGVEGEKYGRSEYHLREDGTVQVTDWIERDGEWRQFNQSVFAKVAE